MKQVNSYKKLVLLFIGTIFVSFTILFITGCGPATPKKPTIKISIWGGTDEIDTLGHIIDEWEKEHPEVNAKLDHIPAGSYTNKLLIRIAGGTAPDIMFVEVNIFVNFWAMNAFMDLKPFIEKDPDFDLDDFFPEVVERFTRDGKIYCIPRDTAPFACVYYNKKLFDEAGIPYPTDDWDWYDLLDKAQKLTKKAEGGRITQYGFYGWTWHNFIYSNGGGIVDDIENPKEFMLNRPKAIEGLKFYADLINKYEVAPSPIEFGNLGMGAQQLFMSQKLAMYQSGFWESTLFRNIKDFEWDVAMFPKGPTGIRRFGTGGSGYCILKSTKHPDLAWDIVKRLSSEEAQMALAEMGLAQPAIKSIAMGPYFAGSPSLISELHLTPQLDLVFNGTEAVEDAVSRVTPEANRLLKE
jgi:ABC-type glycerol-3-phosphate transport system substrate-binding protein